MITRSQVRMARVALGWGVRELGKRAGVAANTVSRYENGMGMTVKTLEQIQQRSRVKGSSSFAPMTREVRACD